MQFHIKFWFKDKSWVYQPHKHNNLKQVVGAKVRQVNILLLNSLKLHHSLWVRVAYKPIQPHLDSLVWVKKTNTQILSDSGIIRNNKLSSQLAAGKVKAKYG